VKLSDMGLASSSKTSTRRHEIESEESRTISPAEVRRAAFCHIIETR
jgi:hypothetical protein